MEWDVDSNTCVTKTSGNQSDDDADGGNTHRCQVRGEDSGLNYYNDQAWIDTCASKHNKSDCEKVWNNPGTGEQNVCKWE